MRILVTGGDGQLGTCLKIASENSPNKYIFTDADYIDITDKEAVDLGVGCNNFDIIVNCAAYTNVDRAEEQPEIAERINAEAAGFLAGAARKNGCTLIQISTDYVFGGNEGNTPRREDDSVKPTGVYGLSKLHGELAIEKSGCKYLIIRTAWLYSEFGKNFVKTMLELTATRPELKVVFDQVGSPTYARDLANAIVDIIDNHKYEGNEGIYHYSDEGVCSWYDFTQEIAHLAGNTSCHIKPCRSCEFPSAAVRPSYSVLDKAKFKRTFGISIPYWKTSLKACIKNLTES